MIKKFIQRVFKSKSKVQQSIRYDSTHPKHNTLTKQIRRQDTISEDDIDTVVTAAAIGEMAETVFEVLTDTNDDSSGGGGDFGGGGASGDW